MRIWISIALTAAFLVQVSAEEISNTPRTSNLRSFLTTTVQISSDTFKPTNRTTRTTHFNKREGHRPAEEQAFFDQLERRTANRRYFVSLDIDKAYQFGSEPDQLLVEGRLLLNNPGRWDEYLTNSEKAARDQAVKVAKDMVERDYNQRFNYLRQRVVRLEELMQYSGGRCSNFGYISAKQDRDMTLESLKRLKDEFISEKRDKAEDAEQPFRELGHQRLSENGRVRVAMYVSQQLVPLEALSRAKRIDSFVSIEDFTMRGQVTDSRHGDYCRRLQPRITKLTLRATQLRRLTSK